MTNKLTTVMVAMVLGGVFVAGTVASCDDDNNQQVTGTAGRGGTTGAAGRGGTGGATAAAGTGGAAANVTVFHMNMTGSQEVPNNSSAATGIATVTVNRTTGEVVVDGTFSGLSSNVTVAHIHGPAAPGASADPIVPLTVTGTTSGTVTGTGMLNPTQLNDMLGSMTYINVHSVNFPMGEIRAQIVP